MLFLKEASSRFMGDLIGAGDESELRWGMGDGDVGVLCLSSFISTKADLMS